MNDKIEAAQSTAIVEPTSETTLRSVGKIFSRHADDHPSQDDEAKP